LEVKPGKLWTLVEKLEICPLWKCKLE